MKILTPLDLYKHKTYILYETFGIKTIEKHVYTAFTKCIK